MQILAALLDKSLDQRLNGPPGHEGAEARLEHPKLDPGEFDHREAALKLWAVQLFNWQAQLAIHR